MSTPLNSSQLLPLPSFFMMPDFTTACSLQDLSAQLARAVLTLHREAKDPHIDPSRIDTKVQEIAGIVGSVYERVHLARPTTPLSPLAKLSLFLLHLEDGSLSKKSLVEEFRALDSKTRSALSSFVWETGDKPEDRPEYGIEEIEKDPYILLHICNEGNENILEELLQAYHREEQLLPFREELRRLQATSLDQLLSTAAASTYFSQLCWYVWREGVEKSLME